MSLIKGLTLPDGSSMDLQVDGDYEQEIFDCIVQTENGLVLRIGESDLTSTDLHAIAAFMGKVQREVLRIGYIKPMPWTYSA
jgi:hypothetical protein